MAGVGKDTVSMEKVLDSLLVALVITGFATVMNIFDEEGEFGSGIDPNNRCL